MKLTINMNHFFACQEFVSKDPLQQQLTGVLVEVTAGVTYMCGTDGHILLESKIADINKKDVDVKIIIPRIDPKWLKTVAPEKLKRYVFEYDPESACVKFKADFGKVEMETYWKLQYPDYRELIPKKTGAVKGAGFDMSVLKPFEKAYRYLKKSERCSFGQGCPLAFLFPEKTHCETIVKYPFMDTEEIVGIIMPIRWSDGQKWYEGYVRSKS